MKWLSDKHLKHLLQMANDPDFGVTKYRLLEELSRGGMGTVYRAEDTELDREIAVKVLSGPAVDSELAQRMVREAQIIARLEHPGIVPVHDVGVLPDGRVFYAMKLVRGSRLDEYARQNESVKDRLRKFQAVCEAVAFAHVHGVIHRDLKPANIMIGSFGEVLVLDWGVAKIVGLPQSPSEAETLRLPIRQGGINGGLHERRGEIDGQAVIAYVCTVGVEDVDALITTVEANGGTIAVPKMPIPGMGWLVYCKDTEGNIFGMMQPDASAG